MTSALPPGGKTTAFVAKKKTASEASPAKVEPHFEFSSHDLNSDDESLLADIDMLQSMLASIVQKENPKVYELYTELRKYGLERSANPDNPGPSFDQMKKLAFDISPKDALGVLRVFSIALSLVNAAEAHYKLRVMREKELEASVSSQTVGPLPMVEDSVRGTLDIILSSDKSKTKDEIYNCLVSQKVEIVLTAHPTEGEYEAIELCDALLYH